MESLSKPGGAAKSLAPTEIFFSHFGAASLGANFALRENRESILER